MKATIKDNVLSITRVRKVNKGYARVFEQPALFAGRMTEAAGWPDLAGVERPGEPWKKRLPRMVFVSDMGDALSASVTFPYLEKEIIGKVKSPKGRNHIWQWLTKRPARMAEFADSIGGLPGNMMAMTTLTGASPAQLRRVDELRKVNAKMRGLSIEPLWERIPPDKLDLTGIDWVIVGGESGSPVGVVTPFATEWVAELREHCKKHGVAFFVKQLGRHPTVGGELLKLRDEAGGDWNEWPASVPKVREFPKAFHDYRKSARRSRSGGKMRSRQGPVA